MVYCKMAGWSCVSLVWVWDVAFIGCSFAAAGAALLRGFKRSWTEPQIFCKRPTAASGAISASVLLLHRSPHLLLPPPPSPPSASCDHQHRHAACAPSLLHPPPHARHAICCHHRHMPAATIATCFPATSQHRLRRCNTASITTPPAASHRTTHQQPATHMEPSAKWCIRLLHHHQRPPASQLIFVLLSTPTQHCVINVIELHAAAAAACIAPSIQGQPALHHQDLICSYKGIRSSMTHPLHHHPPVTSPPMSA